MADGEEKLELESVFCFPVEKTSTGKWSLRPDEEMVSPGRRNTEGYRGLPGLPQSQRVQLCDENN